MATDDFFRVDTMIDLRDLRERPTRTNVRY